MASEPHLTPERGWLGRLGSLRSKQHKAAAGSARPIGIAQAMLSAAQALHSGEPQESLLECLRLAVVQCGATAGYVMVADDLGNLNTEAAYSLAGTFPFAAKLAAGAGISGQVVQSGELTRISEPWNSEPGSDEFEELIRTVLSVPLLSPRAEGLGSGMPEILGVLTLVHTTNPRAFAPDALTAATGFAALIGLIQTNLRLREFYRTNLITTMERLSTALEEKGGYMKGHSLRVAEISTRIASEMGLDSGALEELRIGTLLHDIGKIAVPDSILNKAGKLTTEEFDVMKTHPAVGYEICQSLGLPESILVIVRNHHERLDGKGYPDGLAGHQLPLALRIVCVADVFDAMASSRPHRKGMAPSQVLVELNKQAGTQFDPVVVETLRSLYERGQLGWTDTVDEPEPLQEAA